MPKKYVDMASIGAAKIVNRVRDLFLGTEPSGEQFLEAVSEELQHLDPLQRELVSERLHLFLEDASCPLLC